MPIDRSSLRLPAALVIMDGHGIAPAGPTNAISQARTPHLDALYESCSHIAIQASGEYVGLPDGQMGNSEVGHLNIGAGRVVYQELTRIDRACEDGSLACNEQINTALDIATKSDSVLHVMGLLSDGGVHSSNEHLYALLKIGLDSGVPRIHVHGFLDGRDVPPSSGKAYVEQLEQLIASIDDARRITIASLSGRYYAMDRDNRWERVSKAYDVLVACSPYANCSPADYIQASYDDGVTDEFVVPASFTQRGIQDNDSVIFFNFRPDRARELTHALTDTNPFQLDKPCRPHFTCLTEYDPAIPASVAFPKEIPANVCADVLADAGLRQYHIAETEKYAHVTFFLNGGLEEKKEDETRVIIPSPKVATYDLQPEMSAPEVTQTLVDAIDNDVADVYIVNFANCDMVGHTGILDAAIAAVEAVDEGVGAVVDAIRRKNGVALVTADHGNADVMVASDGQPHTAHTMNPVPLILADYSGAGLRLKENMDAALCNISPTLLEMIGIAAPPEMNAPSLLA